jgi:Xaa-Pro aminopeptidase
MLKSEAEIDKIRYVAECVSDVFDRLFTFAEVGMSDADLFRRFTIECLHAGVDTVSYLVGGAGNMAMTILFRLLQGVASAQRMC